MHSSFLTAVSVDVLLLKGCFPQIAFGFWYLEYILTVQMIAFIMTNEIFENLSVLIGLKQCITLVGMLFEVQGIKKYHNFLCLTKTRHYFHCHSHHFYPQIILKLLAPHWYCWSQELGCLSHINCHQPRWWMTCRNVIVTHAGLHLVAVI